MIRSRSCSDDRRPRSFSGAVFVGVLFLVLLPVPSVAEPGPGSLPETVHGSVSAVVDGATLQMEGVPGEFRLAGVQVPKGRAEDRESSSAAEAQDGLTALVAGHTVSVHPLTIGTDRDGHILAHLIRDDGLWIQAELVRTGLVRVAVNADTSQFATDLLALEDEARKKHRGLWGKATYAVRAATDTARLSRDTGTFQIVEGRIVTAVRRGDMLYLDFGSDYHDDFTVEIPRSCWPLFKAAALTPETLANKQVRVRGWITNYNGPILEVTVPAMLQVLK